MNQVEEPKKKKSGCGCFGCGCLVIIAFFAALIIGTYFFVNHLVMTYSTDTPIQLSEVEGSDEDYRAIEEKFMHFQAGLHGTEAPVPLVLTDKEINLYLAKQPDLNEISDKIRVKIDNDKIGVMVNVPLADFGWKERYISGEGALKAAIENGEATITIESLTFNGNKLPDEAMKQLQSQNLAEELFKDPKQKKLLEAVDMVIVKNGKLIVVGKKGALVDQPKPTGGGLPDSEADRL